MMFVYQQANNSHLTLQPNRKLSLKLGNIAPDKQIEWGV